MKSTLSQKPTLTKPSLTRQRRSTLSLLGESKKVILSIETSCDETAVAVLSVSQENKFPKIETLSSVVKSQIALHKKMGGVVPEAAARAHIKNILPVTEKALGDAHTNLENIDYIAVTQGPGLVPSLIVGVEFAKALALATGKPIIPVNHMLGHLYSPLKEPRADVFPMISLIVSGGHTMLILMKNIRDYKILGQTVDDAAGEAFDKVAKLLKLPYPGGPEVSKLAEKGEPNFEFPRPMVHAKNYDFSFSGLKTAVLYYLQKNAGTGFGRQTSQAGAQDLPLQLKSDVCKAFQDAVVDVLITKTMRAAKEFKAKSISLSGGVSANKELRNQLRNSCEKQNLTFFVPPFELCTDNAEMIGLAAAYRLAQGYKPKNYKTLKAEPRLQL